MQETAHNQLMEVGGRIKELRTILKVPVEEMALVTGMSVEDYLRHEEGELDCSFGFLCHCAKRFDVDLNSLVTGEPPRLSRFTVVRKGAGLAIKRREGFGYQHLAARLKNRCAEPLLVTAKQEDENAKIELNTHGGQEFNYILSGRLKVQVDDFVEVLEEGDSFCFDSSHPHGMIAIGGDCTFLVMVMQSEIDRISEKKSVSNEVKSPWGDRRFLYQEYMHEVLDERGHLKDVSFTVPDNFNFSCDVLDVLAERTPDKIALMWVGHDGEEKSFTFAQMAEESRRTANYLKSLGIKRGDTVMLVLRRHYQFWMIVTALHRIGAVAALGSNLLTRHDYEYRFNMAKMKAVICSGMDDIADHAESALAASPTVQVKVAVNGPRRDGWHDFNSEYSAFSADCPRDPEQKASDIMLMFFSSGTTGYPKAVVHNFKYPVGHIITARWWQNVDPDGLHLTISDTGWAKSCWGKIYGQWFCEAGVFVYDFDKFNAADIMEQIRRHKITSFCAPPTMYRFFIREDLSQFDLSSVKHAAIAGEALNPEVFQQFYNATGLKVMEGFGQSESTVIIGNFIGMEPKPGSMGKPSPLYNVMLLDADGNPVKRGEVGEIVIKAEPGEVCGLFQGYTLDAQAQENAWHDGLYHTGDTAWYDEDGYYWYVGRVDDLIKSSGYRIGPFEIESVLMELPYVLECAVTGVPDPTRGQVVKATIVLTKNKQPSEELKKEIQNYVKEHTAPYKYPRVIEFMEQLPKTVSGKIIRSALRKAAAEQK